MALNTERLTPRMGDGPSIDLWELPVKAATKVYAGGLAVIDAGYAAPGRTATGLIAAGRFEATVDNSAGAAGAKRVQVRRGTFLFKNSASTDAIAQADVGKDCYIVDDETVAKTDGSASRSKAGRIIAIDPDGVYVQVG